MEGLSILNLRNEHSTKNAHFLKGLSRFIKLNISGTIHYYRKDNK